MQQQLWRTADVAHVGRGTVAGGRRDGNGAGGGEPESSAIQRRADHRRRGMRSLRQHVVLRHGAPGIRRRQRDVHIAGRLVRRQDGKQPHGLEDRSRPARHVVLHTRWCSGASTAHSAQSIFGGVDGNGNAVTATGQVAQLAGAGKSSTTRQPSHDRAPVTRAPDRTPRDPA